MKLIFSTICAGALGALLLPACSEEATSQVTPRAEEREEGATEKKAETRPKVQIAILLDTSSSMDGLIDQAKTQLWNVVNSFSKVAKDEQIPDLEVALYEYGNDGLSIKENYIRRVSPLTEELDVISEKLFSLRTNGGSEFCGAVIERSMEDLEWDPSSDVYKAIFIAGNEPFTQGSVSATKACQSAISKGIVVNSIHCGSESDGISGGWKAGALAAEGDFMVIDQDQAVVHIEAPQDKIIIELSAKLNTTYIPYGAQGHQKLKNQVRQDNNAIENYSSGAANSRAMSKVSYNYANTSWDLVDYCNRKPEEFAKLDKKQLPEEMQKMTNEEIQAHIKKKTAERTEIQNQIKNLNKEREAYVANERKKQAGGKQVDTLDEAIMKAILKQVKTKGYEVKL